MPKRESSFGELVVQAAREALAHKRGELAERAPNIFRDRLRRAS